MRASLAGKHAQSAFWSRQKHVSVRRVVIHSALVGHPVMTNASLTSVLIIRHGGWFLALLASVIMLLILSPTQATTTTVAWRQTVPKRAAQLTDFVGINTRLQNRPSAYQHVNTIVLPRLRELRVKHVRDSLINVGNPDKTLWTHYNSIASLGVRFLLVADPRGISTMTGVVEALNRLLPITWAVQGPNELDVGRNTLVRYRGATYPNSIRYYQQDLYNAVKLSSSSKIRALEVVGPSFMAHNAPTIGPLPCTLGAIHSYPLGRQPSFRLDDLYLPAARIVCPNRQVLATETGYHSALQATSPPQPAVPELVRAYYVPRLYLEYFRRSLFRRAYVYQLLDDEVDAQNPEENFGLVKSNGTPKPAFFALQNMMVHLQDDAPNAATFAPRPLTHRLVGGPTTDVNTVIVQRSNGEYVVFLWRETLCYDLGTRRIIDVPRISLRLELEQTASNITVRRLVNTTITPVSTTRTIPISVDEDPVVVKFKTL
jgi:hypothetical protein